MMTLSTEVAKGVVDSLKSTPFVLAIVVLNIMSLAGFWVVLHKVDSAMERREPLLRACMERTLRDDKRD